MADRGLREPDPGRHVKGLVERTSQGESLEKDWKRISDRGTTYVVGFGLFGVSVEGPPY